MFGIYEQWFILSKWKIWGHKVIRGLTNQTKLKFRDKKALCLNVFILIPEINLKTYMNWTLWVEELLSTPLQSSSASPLLTRGRWTNSPFSSYSSTVSSGSRAWTDRKVTWRWWDADKRKLAACSPSCSVLSLDLACEHTCTQVTNSCTYSTDLRMATTCQQMQWCASKGSEEEKCM